MQQPTFVNLAEAYVCSDCEAVGNSARHCPRCQSEALFAVTRVIPRHHDSVRVICLEFEEPAFQAA